MVSTLGGGYIDINLLHHYPPTLGVDGVDAIIFRDKTIDGLSSNQIPMAHHIAS